MADFDSSLPIFSRANTAPVSVSADTSANALANPIFTQLSDGSAAIGVTGGALDVNITTASVTVDAVNLDIRDLTHVSDSVKVGDGTTLLDILVQDAAYGTATNGVAVFGKYMATPTTFTDGDATHLLTDINGRLAVSATSLNNDAVQVDDAAFTVATSSVSVSGFLADDTTPDSVDEGDAGAARMTLDRKQLIVVTDATTDSQRLAINATGEVGVVQATHGDLNANVTLQINDVDVSATVPVPVSATAAANAETNPIFVQVVSGALSGIEVLSYDTTASVASDASDNHDYTVTAASTLKVQCCYGSASGAQKISILSGPVAGLASNAVLFTSMANPNWWIDFKGLLEVPDTSTGTLRITRFNRDEGAMDVYSTIIGTEV